MNQYTGFYSVHPGVAFLFYVVFFTLSMLFMHPVFLMTALIAGLMMNVLQDKGRRLRRYYLFYVLACLILGLLNPLFSHRGKHILFYVLDQPITLESVMFGFVLMLSVLVMLIGFLSFVHIINESKLLFLFASLMPKTALLCMMAIRFVPLLRRRLMEIMRVQHLRGFSMLQGSVFSRGRNGMKILHILLTWSMEEALQTADSMKARGYGLSKRRSSYYTYRMERRDVMVLIMIALLGGLCFIYWKQGAGVLDIYPELESLALAGPDRLTYAAYVAFLLIPIGIELKEILRWTYSK